MYYKKAAMSPTSTLVASWATESCETPAKRGRRPGAPAGERKGRELVRASSP